MDTIRETSDFVCQKLISKLPITDNIRLLEPSCGDGKILKYLIEHYKLVDLDVVCVELNKERLSAAASALEGNVPNSFNDFAFYQEDFLRWNDINHRENVVKLKPFDCIIACPPFKNNIDLEHIKLMYDLLKKKGMMATLTSPFWITNNEAHQVEFRKWLADKEYELEILPDNSFMEKGKSVPTAILTIYKRN